MVKSYVFVHSYIKYSVVYAFNIIKYYITRIMCSNSLPVDNTQRR